MTIFELNGHDLRIAAHWGAVLSQEIGVRFPCTRGSVAGRTVIDRKPVHVIDLQAEAEEFPEGYAFAKRLGQRTTAGVPLLREGVAIGTIQLRRTEVNPFTEKQIALLGTFAAQAVIAIENTRLLNELRERTADLSEALEQQTATSEVLKVISSSPGGLEPVFEAILENATRICEAKFGVMQLMEGDGFRAVALHDVPSAYAEAMRNNPVFHPVVGHPLDRLAGTKQVVHITDVRAEQRMRGWMVELAGARTLLLVPMLKDNELVGVISIYRQEVCPFTDKQIALVQNFAAQAVIAIENTRLLNELRESLDRQTATSEVLEVISGAPGELLPVFRAILENATRICEAKFGNLMLSEGETFRVVALHNAPSAYAEFRQREPVIRPGPQTALSRLRETKQTVHIQDISLMPVASIRFAELGGARSVINVPILKDNELVGVIVIYRQEVRPFSDKQIELLQNFAAQAVIAIENARLLSELRQRTTDLSESLEQQTATSEVLKVISSSPGDLQPVFEAMLANAVRLCEAKFGVLYRYDGHLFHPEALIGAPQPLIEFHQRRGAFETVPGTPLHRLWQTGEVVHTADDAGSPSSSPSARFGGARSHLAVPMFKGDALVGSIIIYRQEVRPFTDKQVDLVKNFAAQAVIAIENTRLLGELRQRTEDVVKLNQQLEQRVADQVGEIERMGRLRRFLPPQVADLIVASGTEKQLESHRREITALFCDLRGFTGFSESSDPEDVMALLRDYHAAIGKIVIKYSGTLERYAGDGVMVVFNDPVPVENPALQAVLMALEMRNAIGALTETWHRLGHDIGFGIGIAHGFATLGTIGFEGRFDYAAIGTVSNVASRLCDEAKPGQILINPRVLSKVENAVTVEPVGEFELKGIRRPMMAYNVLEVLSSKPN